MNEEYKCKDCKWLTGKKNIRGIECMNPKLQEKWNKAKTLWMGELRKDTARYKQRNAPACKKFEAKESKPISRYIDADALMAELQKDADAFDDEADNARKNAQNYTDGDLYSVMGRADGIRDAMMEVYDAPSIELEPKRGEWLIEKTLYDNYNYRCSYCDWYECHAYPDVEPYNFCPNCGARMKGADDE